MNKQHSYRRRRLFVDPEVQSGMLSRLVVYWLCSALFITLPLAFVYTLMDSSMLWINHVVDVWVFHWPIFATMTVMFPFAYYDLLKFSNRFVGPIFRLRAELTNIFETGETRRIKFRTKDYWQDVAEGFNRLVTRIDELEQQLAKEQPPVSHESKAVPQDSQTVPQDS